ncbi:class I adenylate-forming enzyme family protein [Streptosporangium sp. NBC_01469]|uniref:class I adenylate-forming enzyme family protein n=1 Tax=Streptosporangium sp. NBC_01469 TaxID=2903898 RepID=UPI002E2A7B94|nr:class I adenylate-forming enzyme family protein [Streptosporangium sp. NBC_01469]
MTLRLDDLVPAALRRRWAADGTCPDLDLYALFRTRRLAAPDRVAVIDTAGELTYAELDRLARSAAAGLRRLGVCEGDVVGVQLPNGRDAVVADLAVAALGAVALPFPAGRGVAEAASLLGRSGARAVVAAVDHRGSAHARELVSAAGDLPGLRAVIAAGPQEPPPGSVAWSEVLSADGGAFVPARPDPDGAARILVSSGSESEPKMVAYSHNALAGGRGNFMATLIPGGSTPRCLFLVPLASAFGSNGTAVTLARHGGCLVLLDHFSPRAALAAIREHRPTHVLAVPTMVRMMLDQPDAGPTPPMTALVLGGAELDAATAAEAGEAFGCPVINLYGSADGVNCHSGFRPATAGDAGPGVVVGLPDPRVAEIRIAAPPDGERFGEIIARGPMTPMCYVGAPELNRRYRTADGWVRTGDLGVIDADGRLRLMGRLKQVVIRGGANISPAEVERALADHPEVREVVCLGVPDQVMGERLAACVVPRPGRVPDLPGLSSHLLQRGLERGKHPERLLLVQEVPLTPAGKPDRDALRDLLLGGHRETA